jgi:hypothetical protein
MAEGKKSFIAYCDWGEIFDELEDKEAGKLVKHLFDYVRDRDPKTDDKLIKILFIQIQQSLKRDLKKYENICDRNRINGGKGGRPKKPKEPNGLLGNPKEPKEPDKESDTVNGTDNVNGNGIESVINKNTHPALVGFRNNVLKEANEQGIKIEVAEKFIKHWTAIDEHTKLFLYQATEPFGIQNRLKNWQKIENKTNQENKVVDINSVNL